MDALDAVREFRLRVIVATDLIARGVDLGALLSGRAELNGTRQCNNLPLLSLYTACQHALSGLRKNIVFS